MLGLRRWQLFKGLVTAVGIVTIVSLALIYFIPAPPSKISIRATGNGGISNITAANIEKYSRVLTLILSCARQLAAQGKTWSF